MAEGTMVVDEEMVTDDDGDTGSQIPGFRFVASAQVKKYSVNDKGVEVGLMFYKADVPANALKELAVRAGEDGATESLRVTMDVEHLLRLGDEADAEGDDETAELDFGGNESE